MRAMKRACSALLLCALLWLTGCGTSALRLTYSGSGEEALPQTAAADSAQTDYAALNQRGYDYQYGVGTAADIDKAIECYTEAAEHGIPEAMTNLGRCYERGEGVAQDYARALALYTKAAELGEAMAINNIGWLYENGYGVEQSYETAYEYYTRAADAGCELAKENMAYMEENGLVE